MAFTPEHLRLDGLSLNGYADNLTNIIPDPSFEDTLLGPLSGNNWGLYAGGGAANPSVTILSNSNPNST